MTAVDLVVVGAGIAGLTAGRIASAAGLRVLVVAKDGPTATSFAQGGIAVARRADVEVHVADTLAAGDGLCDVEAVRTILTGAGEAVDELRLLGTRFDQLPDGSLAMTREGGHSINRIIHAGGDATGRVVQDALSAVGPEVRHHSRILEVRTDDRGITGAVIDGPAGIEVIDAPAVLLATGGIAGLFAAGTNPTGSTGDGIAVALRAGARVADMEFVQFHPTALWIDGAQGRVPLVSEAVRGEGAVLVDLAGRSVTAGVHPLGDLAPRDIVARAIARRLRETGAAHVWLDARGIAGFAERFPTVTRSCREAGIDPTRDRIPVAPAAHYLCGGVVTDTSGRTDVPGLFAAGEVARTGLHGANRLASNSLLEGLVVARRCVDAIVERLRDEVNDRWEPRPTAITAEPLPTDGVRRILSRAAGVVRTEADLADADRQLAGLTSDNALVARMVITAARDRAETRGCHTRLDHPDTDPALARSTTFAIDAEGRAIRLGETVAVGEHVSARQTGSVRHTMEVAG